MESSIIKRERVQFGPVAGASRKHTEAGSAPRAAKAQAVVVAGVVQAIEVTCACGEVLLVELEYTETTEARR
jgi:hypothetical protein